LGLFAIVVAIRLDALARGRTVQESTPLQQSEPQARQLRVPMNKGRTIRLDFAFTDVLVGASKIAEVILLSDRTRYILGKSATNVSVLTPPNDCSVLCGGRIGQRRYRAASEMVQHDQRDHAPEDSRRLSRSPTRAVHLEPSARNPSTRPLNARNP
jgi:hypothetical protein